jgi:hypothetical protein
LAVVSQPSGPADGNISAPGKIDDQLGEFWLANPWSIAHLGRNLSAHERKRAFLNLRGRDFLDISYLTGADNDGDGRSVVAADFRNNGRLDLMLRQAGGGALRLYQNEFPQRHYLKVSLRGRSDPRARVSSNRRGIGARLIAMVRGQPLVRELYPLNSFASQMPSQVHFCLGDSTRVDRLTIRWPSGKVQELVDLPADRHILVDEGLQGDAAVELVRPGETIRP